MRKCICTGFGDRMGFIIGLAAIADVYYGDNATVSMFWCQDAGFVAYNNPRHYEFVPGWTGFNYPVEEVRGAIDLPSNVVLVTKEEGGEREWAEQRDGAGVGWDCEISEGRREINELIWMANYGHRGWSVITGRGEARRGVTSAEFLASYYKRALQMGPTLRVQEQIRKSIGWFDVVVHIRAIDKNTYDPLIPAENYCTQSAIRQVVDVGMRVAVVSHVRSFAKRVLGGLLGEGNNAGSIRILRKMSDWGGFAYLLSGSFGGIIQHAANGWSCFSSVPANIKMIPLLAAYDGANGAVRGQFHTHHRLDDFEEFAAGYAVPDFFYRCGNVSGFISHVRERCARIGYAEVNL